MRWACHNLRSCHPSAPPGDQFSPPNAITRPGSQLRLKEPGQTDLTRFARHSKRRSSAEIFGAIGRLRKGARDEIDPHVSALP